MSIRPIRGPLVARSAVEEYFNPLSQVQSGCSRCRVISRDDGRSITPSSNPMMRSPQSNPLNCSTSSAGRASSSCDSFLVFHDSVGTHWGASLSHVLGDSAVGYLEWAGVREPSLTARALAFGERTGVFPPDLTELEHVSDRRHFSSDLSAGISWTGSANLTLNIEYHYHGSGLSDSDLARAFERGTNNARSAAQFWYLRQYAADQQEPLTRREWFVRADWRDVIPSTLNLAAVASSPRITAQHSGRSTHNIFSRGTGLSLHTWASPLVRRPALSAAFRGIAAPSSKSHNICSDLTPDLVPPGIRVRGQMTTTSVADNLSLESCRVP
jgi:hypothetical protein